jgi:hypothetical protein
MLDMITADARYFGKSSTEIQEAVTDCTAEAVRDPNNRACGREFLCYRRDGLLWSQLYSRTLPFHVDAHMSSIIVTRSSAWAITEAEAKAFFGEEGDDRTMSQYKPRTAEEIYSPQREIIVSFDEIDAPFQVAKAVNAERRSSAQAPRLQKLPGWDPREYQSQVLVMKQKFLSSKQYFSEADFAVAYRAAFRTAAGEIKHLKHPAYQKQHLADMKVWFALFGGAQPFPENCKNCDMQGLCGHIWWMCHQLCHQCGKAAHSPLIDCVRG